MDGCVVTSCPLERALADGEGRRIGSAWESTIAKFPRYERFKKRENIVFKKLHMEAAEVDMVSRNEWLEDQWGQTRQEYMEES